MRIAEGLGVRALGIKPELLLALIIVDGVFQKNGYEVVITSLMDGKHSRTSLHYAGCAADVRSKTIPVEDHQKLATQCRGALGKDYDFIVESNHFHLESQPKGSY